MPSKTAQLTCHLTTKADNDHCIKCCLASNFNFKLQLVLAAAANRRVIAVQTRRQWGHSRH
jgi:hypothetical protein